MVSEKNINTLDFSEDILNYLREHHGKLVPSLTMIEKLTERVRSRTESRKMRGRLLSTLAVLIRQKKVIRYRKRRMVNRRPSSSQGLVRISELYT